MIAFLGMGHLGANFVRAMLKRGEQVRVWNRTPSKAKALEEAGAIVFDRVEDAVEGMERIHLALKDDRSVNELLQLACGSFQHGLTIVDHTTTSQKGAIDRAEYWRQNGCVYLHAPVFMGPQNALDGTGYMMVSGDKYTFSEYEKDLAKMTGKLMYMGKEPGKAAGMKLIGNLFLLAMTGGMADMLALSKAFGLAPEEIGKLLDMWNPGAMLPARFKRVSGGKYDDPTWELHMARKDARLMMEGAEAADLTLATIPGLATLMDSYIARGHANDDYSVVGLDYLAK